MAYGREQFCLEYQCVTRYHLLAELYIFNLEEIGAPAFGFFHGVEHQQSAHLSQGLNLQYTGHDRLLREMTLEERFVGSYVLYADNVVGSQLDDLVHELHGIAVGQEFLYLLDVHDGLLVGIVPRGLDVVLADFLAHHTRKHIVDGVSGAGGNDASLDGTANQCHVSDDVQQFVACGLVVPNKRLVLDVTKFLGIVPFGTGLFAQFVQYVLTGFLLIDDHCVVQVAALYQSGGEQGCNLAHKHESACGGHFAFKVVHVVQGGKLAAEHLGVE